MTVAHLSDAELVATLDRQLASRPGTEMEEHLSGCSSCRERLTELEVQSEALGRWFDIDEQAALPTPAPRLRPATSRGPRPRYLMAAGVVLFLGLGLSPLRGLVVQWMGMAPRSNTESPTGGVAPQTHRFDFDVGDGPFELSITGQPQGLLVVRLEATEGGSIGISGGDGTETVSLGPASAAIEVGPTEGTRIEVTLPAELAALNVTVAGDRVLPEWTPTATASPRTWTLRLGGG